MAFFPKADGTILRPASSVVPPRPSRQTTVGPIYDLVNYENPIKPWSSDVEKTFYTKESTNLVTPIPEKPPTFSHRYLRAFLAENERLRLSVLWYYTRGILEEDELLAGLQEKAQLAQESTEWEFAVVGILDINVYSRLATVGLELGNLPRGETICAHTVTQPPGVRLQSLTGGGGNQPLTCSSRMSFSCRVSWRIGDSRNVRIWKMANCTHTLESPFDSRPSLVQLSAWVLYVSRQAKAGSR